MRVLTPDTMLTRTDAAEELARAGYPTKKSSLATMATRGGGPIYRLYGRTPLYRWADLLNWAEGRCSNPRTNSSQKDIGKTVA